MTNHGVLFNIHTTPQAVARPSLGGPAAANERGPEPGPRGVVCPRRSPEADETRKMSPILDPQFARRCLAGPQPFRPLPGRRGPAPWYCSGAKQTQFTPFPGQKRGSEGKTKPIRPPFSRPGRSKRAGKARSSRESRDQNDSNERSAPNKTPASEVLFRQRG